MYTWLLDWMRKSERAPSTQHFSGYPDIIRTFQNEFTVRRQRWICPSNGYAHAGRIIRRRDGQIPTRSRGYVTGHSDAVSGEEQDVTAQPVSG